MYYFECPACGRNRSFHRPAEEPSSTGCMILLVGGFLPALLHSQHYSGRVQCADCGYIFRQPPLPSSPAASLAGWIALIVISAAVFVMLAVSIPEIAELLPTFWGVAFLEELIVQQSRVFALCFLIVPPLILATCLAAGCWSNHKHRQALSKRFHLKPMASHDPLARQIRKPSDVSPPSDAGTSTPSQERLDYKDNLTPRAQQTILLAIKEADRCGHGLPQAGHLALGFIRLGEGVACDVLGNLGVDVDALRTALEKAIEPRPAGTIDRHRYAHPEFRRILNIAYGERGNLEHTYTGTEHILLDLLIEETNPAGRILKEMGVDIESCRREVLRQLDPNLPGPDQTTRMPES